MYHILLLWIFVVTGASFIVFNGALKTTNDVKAKVSIVEGNYSEVSIVEGFALSYWIYLLSNVHILWLVYCMSTLLLEYVSVFS